MRRILIIVCSLPLVLFFLVITYLNITPASFKDVNAYSCCQCPLFEYTSKNVYVSEFYPYKCAEACSTFGVTDCSSNDLKNSIYIFLSKFDFNT